MLVTSMAHMAHVMNIHLPVYCSPACPIGFDPPGQPTASLIDGLKRSCGALGNSITSQKFFVVWKRLSDDDPNWRTDFWELKPPIRSKIGLAWWKGLQTCTLQMFLHVTCFNRKLIEKFLWDIKYYKTIFEIYRYIVVSLISGFSVFLCFVGLL